MKQYYLLMDEGGLSVLFRYLCIVSCLFFMGSLMAQTSTYDNAADWDVFPIGNLTVQEVSDAFATDGAAIEITTAISTVNWYDALIQTFQNNTPAMVNGKEYTVSLKYRAASDRQLRVIIAGRPTDTYGPEDNRYYEEFVNATTEYQDFSFTFVSNDLVEGTLHLQLFAGGDDTSFFIDEVTISVTEPEIPETYAEIGDWSVFPVDNLTLTEEADADALNGNAIKVMTNIETANWWEALIQTQQDQAISIINGNEYTVRFQYKSEADRQVRVVIAGRPTDTYGPEDNQYYSEFINSTGTYQEFSYTFTSNDTQAGTVHAQLFVGGNATPFFLDDFKITEKLGTPPDDENYDTVADWDAFPIDNFTITEEADADAINGSAIKFTTEVTTVNWYDALLQTFQSNTPALAEGNQYTIRFRHRAEADRQIRVVIAGRPTDTYGPEDNQYYSEFVNVSNTYQDFSFTFASTDTEPGSVHVQLFAGGDETGFFVDDFDITVDDGTPTGEEPFEDVDKWNTYPINTLVHEIVTDASAVNQEAIKVSVDSTTTLVDQEWYNAGFQILQDEGVVEEEGKRYRVSFRYRADSDRQVWFGLRSRPYDTFGTDDTDYFGNFLNFTSEYQDFIRTITVTAPDSVLSTIYTAFFMGGSDVPIYIDNFQIVEAAELRTEPTTLYVNPIGSDTNPGTSNTAEGAFRTIGQALSQLIPGDSLLIADGLYQENSLELENIKGNPDLVTTVKSINRWGAKIEGTSQYDELFAIVNSDYIVIDGIEVFNNNNVELEDWNAGVEATGSNHVTIKNVYAHDCGCNGISGREGDYFTFENNVLQDNAKTNPYNCSGMSIYQPIALDDAPGYHIIIRNNVAFENECRLPFSPRGFTIPTDGNGIILDDFNHTQSEGIPAYTPNTLVENNLTFNNGGAGIKIYEVANATIRNNTAWHNNYVLREFSGGLGDIGVQAVNGAIEIYNNISVEEFGQENGHGLFIQTTNEATVALENNIVVGSRSFEGAVPIEQDNTFVSVNQQSYPAFTNATTDIQFSSASDFRNYFGLREISPAIDAGNTDLGAVKDLEGIDRPIGSATDIGAYEGPTDSDTPLPPDETLIATIQNTQTPIVIDGVKDGAYIGGVNDITKQSVSLEDVSDRDDLSASWTALWDETNLYLQIAVTDETITDDSADTIDDDSIEIHIDGDNSKAENYNDDDYIFLLGTGTGATLQELLRNDVSGVDAEVTDTDTGYSAEIAIPWTKIGVTPTDSLKIALDIQINDDDTGGARDSKIAWQDLLEDNTTIPSRLGEGLIVVLPPPPAVAKTAVPVEIDGVEDTSWNSPDTISIETNVSGEVSDSDDLAGTWKAQWDENALYFFISVTDDDLQNDSDPWYEDDGVEIYIDSDNSKNTTYGSDDHQLTIGWNNGNLIEDTKDNIGPGSTVAVVDTNQGYDVEVSIPWSALGLTPTAGQFIGLDVHIIDDDEGGARSGKLSWFSQIDESYRDPSLFGNIFLKDASDPGNDTAYGEVGNTTGNHIWNTVNYNNTYTDPVVVMGPLSTNGNQPTTVRVKNTAGAGFQWQVDEWAYLDGPHLVESISYMVVETGSHVMENGSNLVAGKADVGTSWTTVSLPAIFNDAPIVVPQVITVNGGQPVDVRIRNICATSFQLKLQEEENGGDGSGNRAHAIETIGWVAIEAGTASGDGTGLLEVANTGNVVDHKNYQLNFGQSYPNDQRVFIAHEQTTNGGDPGTLRFKSNSFAINGITLFFQEEKSKDQETGHVKENVGFAVFGSTGNLIAGNTTLNSAQGQNLEIQVPREILLYPNPTFGEAKVAMTGMVLAKGTLTVMDLTGNTVLRAQISEDKDSIDVASLPNGLYIVRINAGDASYTTKLYKQ